MELVEKAKVRLEIEDEEAKVTLESLTLEAKNINKELRNLKESGEVGSEAWKELKEKQRDVVAELKEFKTAIDINDASMNELTSRSRQLYSELNKLKVGSEEWLAKLEEVNQVTDKIDDVKAAVKGVSNAMEASAKDIDLNNASLNELSSHHKKLIDELKDLTVGTKEFTEKAEQVRQVKDIMEQAEKSVKGVSNAMEASAKDIDLNNASLNELSSHHKKLIDELKDLTVGTKEFTEKAEQVRQVKDIMEQAEKSVKGLGDEVQKQPGLWDNMKTTAVGVFTGTALFDLAKEAASAIFDFGKEVFETTAKFEKYDAILKNALGTQEAATAAMDDIKKMAASTPYSVDELTESYIKYINRGLQPSMAEMTKMGDIAASQGKSFDQLTEAVLDAGTGEFERLKEFGIQASKNGEQVELSFKGIQKTVANTPESINKAILSFGEMQGVAGSMAAITQTLEGRVSNLGDNFDTLKITIGDGLKPVFGFLLDAMNIGITVAQDLFSGTSPLTSLFESLGEIFGNIWNSAKSLFETWLDGAKSSGYLDLALESLTFALKAVATSFLAGLTAVNIFLDALNILINKGKEVANFFGAEFKIDPKANFDTLSANASKNFASIEKLWTDTNAKNVKTTVETNKKIDTEHEKSAKGQTDTHNKEAEKRAKEDKKKRDTAAKEKEKLNKQEEKAETDLQKKIDTMKIKSMKDEKARKTEELNFKYTAEENAIKKSVASDAKKQQALKLLASAKEVEVSTMEETFRKKKEDEDKKLRDKTAADEKKLRDEKLKETKTLLDTEFQAEVAKAQNTLDLTSTNSKAMWDAKRALLETEWKYKQQQLANEAAAEKARIAESVSDTDQQRVAKENIDAKLKAKLSSEELKFQLDKTKLNEEQNKNREQNNTEFFSALKSAGDGDVKSTLSFLKKKADEDKLKNKESKEDKVKLMDAFKGLMEGDTSLFIKFMGQKIKTDKDGNATQLQQFADKTQKVADIAIQGINFLKDLNTKYLNFELDKIKKEETEQLASWEREYKAGKISKEEYDAVVVKTTKDTKEKELAARKDAFEREKKMNIAAAAINTAQAALKSFAMFGWPIGAIMAALAAVAGGIQIAAIARQRFEGRLGGVFNAVGKIFARSGAVVPRNAFISKGDRHGATYGQSGISMINRSTGEEVGEIEGDEPVMVLSRNTYKNNGKLVDRLLHSSLYKNGAPITMASGGVLTASGKRMYEDGGVFDTGSSSITPANTDSMMEESRKSSKDMGEIKDNTAQMRDLLKQAQRQEEKNQNFGSSQFNQIARTFYDMFQAHGRTLNNLYARSIETRDELRKHTVSLNDIDRNNKTGHYENYKQLRMHYEFAQRDTIINREFFNRISDDIMEQNSELHRQNIDLKNRLFMQNRQYTDAWHNEERSAHTYEQMLERYMLNELQVHSQKLNEIRDKPTGTGDILHALGRIEANVAKSNLK